MKKRICLNKSKINFRGKASEISQLPSHLRFASAKVGIKKMHPQKCGCIRYNFYNSITFSVTFQSLFT